MAVTNILAGLKHHPSPRPVSSEAEEDHLQADEYVGLAILAPYERGRK